MGADVSDQDSGSLDQVRWQWSKSMAEDGEFSDISGATSPTYTPETEDIGYYLQATATYSDGLGARAGLRQCGNGVCCGGEAAGQRGGRAFADDTPVASPTTSEQSRTVRETAKAGDSVGNAVTASDSDNDPLLYELEGVAVTFSTSEPTAGDPGVPTADHQFRCPVHGLTTRADRSRLRVMPTLAFLNFEEYATTDAVPTADAARGPCVGIHGHGKGYGPVGF